MDHALIILLALTVNALFGGPAALYEATGLARLGRIPAKLLRDRERNYRAPERQMLLIAYTLACALVAGGVAHFILRQQLQFLEILLVATMLPVRPTFERAWKIKSALEKNDVPSARQALDGTVWRHHILLDAHGAARAAVELVAVNFSEKILQPILWYLPFGLPGLFLCKSFSLIKETLPSSFAAERQLNQLMLHIPAASLWIGSRLTALLLVGASSFLPGAANARDTFKRCANEATKTPALPYVLFAAASVLNLSLGGPTSAYVNTQWLGSGTPKAAAGDVARVVALLAFSLLLLFIGLGLLL